MAKLFRSRWIASLLLTLALFCAFDTFDSISSKAQAQVFGGFGGSGGAQVPLPTGTGVLISTNQSLSLYTGTSCVNQLLRALSAIGGGTCTTITASYVDSSIAVTGSSNSWADGVKQTFNPNGTNAGFNLGAHTADPSSGVNGDMYYNSTSNKFRCYENGAWANCIGSGGSGADANGFYLVSKSTNAPTNAVNLGALSTGLVKCTIASSTCTPSTATPGTDYLTTVTAAQVLSALAAATGNLTIQDGSNASFTITFNVSGTDTVFTLGNGTINLSSGSFQVGGNSVLTAVSESNLSFSDVTTANVSTIKHGLAPKLPNDATKYLDGTGGFTVPAGSADLSGAHVTCTNDCSSQFPNMTNVGTPLSPDDDTIAVGNGSAFQGKTLPNGVVKYDPSSNTLSAYVLPVKVWFAAGGCNNATAAPGFDLPTSNAAVPACKTGTNTQMGVLDFADSANLSAQAHLKLPSDFTSTVDAKLVWLTSATSGSVVWQVATICVADAETDDPSFNTASTVTDAAKGTTNQLNDASITGVTITGCAAGELMHIKVFRDSANGSDDLAATARLVGMEITYRRAL